MKLTLTYDGQLSSSGNGSKKAEKKWELRRNFHDQLSELWQISPTLKFAAKVSVPTHGGAFLIPDQYHGLPQRELNQSYGESEKIQLFAPIEKHGKLFTPLVRNSAALVCGIDVLFLRREEPGKVFQKGHRGDLDNRLKTLFDGLRMPEHVEEVEAGGPDIPQPMYCLLEDDELITAINVRTGQLLAGANRSRDEVRLVIDVTIKATQVRAYNMPFTGD